MQFRVSRVSRDECSAEEWEARVDLAAAHRLAVMHGLNEGIFNHLTQVVPGKPDRYYQIPFGMHWSEVKASSFMEVGINDGEVKRGETSSGPAIAFTPQFTRRCRRLKPCSTRICRLPVRSPVSKIPTLKRSAKRKSA